MTMLSTPLKVTSLKSVMVSKSAVFCSMLWSILNSNDNHIVPIWRSWP
jgi:hypothetical protein